jgi:hypothetical protein
MSHLFVAGDVTPLSLTLDDGATAYYPRAWIFTNGSLLGSIDLGHIGLGRYSAAWVPAAAVTYDILYITYFDALHTVISALYGYVMEKWQPDTIITNAVPLGPVPGDVADAVWNELLAEHVAAGSAGEFLGRLTAARAANIDDSNVRTRLIEKILRNKLELTDGSTNNWVLYDDDNTTPLLTWSVSDKDGDAIVQQKHVPSRRSRGV